MVYTPYVSYVHLLLLVLFSLVNLSLVTIEESSQVHSEHASEKHYP